MLSRSASWMTGTTKPPGAATAIPMFTRFLRMIASPSQDAFTIRCSLRASATTFATNARCVRLTPSRRAKSPFACSLSRTRFDTSASTRVQASGTVAALLVMFSAIMRRTGVTGTRSSSAAGPDSIPRASMNACTSFRVTLPLMPVPVSWDRSTSCCSARRSTAGE